MIGASSVERVADQRRARASVAPRVVDDRLVAELEVELVRRCRGRAQTPRAISSISSGIRSRTSGSNERVVPVSTASPGITFGASPACRLPTVTTAGSSGSIRRDDDVLQLADERGRAAIDVVGRVREAGVPAPAA